MNNPNISSLVNVGSSTGVDESGRFVHSRQRMDMGGISQLASMSPLFEEDVLGHGEPYLESKAVYMSDTEFDNLVCSHLEEKSTVPY